MLPVGGDLAEPRSYFTHFYLFLVPHPLPELYTPELALSAFSQPVLVHKTLLTSVWVLQREALV